MIKIFKAFRNHYVFFLVALFFGIGVYFVSGNHVKAPSLNDLSAGLFTRNTQLADIGQVVASPNPSDVSKPKPPAAGHILIYFNNGALDPALECARVFPIDRIVGEENASPETALKTLFAGLTWDESMQGYFTSISPVMPLRSIRVNDSIATVDLGPEVVGGVAPGSCRAQAIRAQITETLRAFPDIQQVIILVNGDAKNILNNQ